MQFIRSKEWWMNRVKDEPDGFIGGGAYYAKQPLSLRVWHFLGFYGKHDEDLFDWRNMETPEDGFVQSCLHTETHIVLDWKDRLRVMFTGHLRVDVWTKTDVAVKLMKSRSQIAVLPPIQKSSIRQDLK